MMLKRSNHIPTFTRIAADEEDARGAPRLRANQKTWGTTTLQETIVQ